MSMKFLTDEWADAATEAFNADAGFRKEVAKKDSLIHWSISDAPDGDVEYYLDLDHGQATLALGEPSAEPDLNLSCSYETLVGIVSGRISGRDAFQGRKLRADVRLITVIRYLGVFHEMGRVMSALDVEY
jgi:hypothetical protein